LNASAVEEDMQYEKSKKKVNKKNTKTKKIRIIFDAFEKRKMKKKNTKKRLLHKNIYQFRRNHALCEHVLLQ
jgi:hypothetical protein